MARSNRKKTKPAVKSNAGLKGSGRVRMDWAPSNKNYGTLRKLQEVKSLEEEAKPLNDTKENAIETMRLEIEFPNTNI